MNEIAIVVLAAGKSTRMGSIKQLEKINNKTLLEIVLTKAKTISKQVFCVLGANALTIKKATTIIDCTFINNPNFEAGLSTSIVSAISYFSENNLNYAAVLFLLADQPAIDPSYLKAMTTTFKKNKKFIIVSNYNQKPGIPAIFPEHYFNDLKLLKGDKGAREMLLKHKKNLIFEAQKTNLIDLDTQKELKDFKNLAKT